MLEIDISEGELFNSSPDPNIWIPGEEYGPTPALGRNEFLRLVEEGRAIVDSFLDECDRVYETAPSARVFESRIETKYQFYTKKGDSSVADVQRYAIRDGIQWLTMWVGHHDSELWNCMAKLVGYTGSVDDICVRPEDVESKRYFFAGETLHDIIRRMGELGGPARDARWFEPIIADICYASRVQFYEKWAACADADARCPDSANTIDHYVNDPDFLRASIIRNFSTMTIACICMICYFYRFDFDDADWPLLHATALGDCLTMDIGKDAAGVGVKCATNFGERVGRGDVENRARRAAIYHTNRALDLTFFKDATTFDQVVCRRYARVGLSFATKHDRYLERRNFKRFPLHGALLDLVTRVEQTRPRGGECSVAPTREEEIVHQPHV